MVSYPVFLSVVVPLRNEAATLENTLQRAHETLSHPGAQEFNSAVMTHGHKLNIADVEISEPLSTLAAYDNRSSHEPAGHV